MLQVDHPEPEVLQDASGGNELDLQIKEFTLATVNKLIT